MQKVILQFAALVGAFLLIWFLLSKIPFINRDSLQSISKKSEKELGDLLMKSLSFSRKEIQSKELLAIIDSVKQKIIERNNIDSADIKIHIISNADVNAFALPDDHLVIYTGLIDYCNNESELAGVIAHEIGHIEKNHVTKKLVKELGMAMLMTLAGGDAGPEIAKETTKILSSSSFDREQESEADKFAVEAMAKAGFDPSELANFLFRVSQLLGDIPEELAWINTHPDSKDRAAETLKIKKEITFTNEKCIQTPWADVKLLLDGLVNENK
jgi:beta-barrel assembly-enhancing protease